MQRFSTKAPSYLDPQRMYSLDGFHQASGISRTRVRAARRAGVYLPALKVGKRKFIRGRDAISYIEALACLPIHSPAPNDRQFNELPLRSNDETTSPGLDIDGWLYERWQLGKKTWNEIREEALALREQYGWPKLTSLNGIRTRAKRYAQRAHLPFRLGRGGRPNKSEPEI